MSCPGYEGIWKSCDFEPYATPVSLQPLVDIGILGVLILAGVGALFFTLYLVMILRSR